MLLPDDAQDVKLRPIQATSRRTNGSSPTSTVAKPCGWAAGSPPGGSSYITVSYRLPDGTFGTGGNLEYRAGVEHR